MRPVAGLWYELMRVAYYCPFMRPDAQAASGAARMGALFEQALRQSGADVIVPDLPLTRDAHGDAPAQERARVQSTEAAGRLLAMISAGVIARPDLWFSYHVYYKAPDWIGPAVSRALGIPYVVAEGSHAPKRADGAWKSGHASATQALLEARLLLVMTDFDKHCLLQLQPRRVVDFKPFIDTRLFRQLVHEPPFQRRLLSVGMMRDMRKVESYRMVAETMSLLATEGYSLVVAGDGKHRAVIETLFDRHVQAGSAAFLGEQSAAQVRGLMDRSDLLLWPGIGEAYGLTYLEAQASGLPVIACRNRGVVDVTRDGETAILCPPGDCDGLARSIRALSSDPLRYRDMRMAAHRFVHQERSLAQAGLHLRQLLTALLA